MFGSKFQKMEKMDHLPNIVSEENYTFDKRYKTIIQIPYGPDNWNQILWLNGALSARSVDIHTGNGIMYIAFENEDDALIFKIKFL